MTKLLANPTIYEQGGDLAQSAGTAPLGTGAMQGNPQDSQARQNNGVYPPQPTIGGAGQTVNTPLKHDQVARGNIPLNVQPTSVGGAAGVDSLMAQLSRGQVIRNQSTYGQGSLVPLAGNQTVVAAPSIQPQAVGIGSVLTVASPATYVGD